MLRLGPLRLHWSLLLGALLFCAAEPRPLLLLGYAAVLLAHVTGHALAVSGTRLHVHGVTLHGLGGELMGEGEIAPVRRSLIALSGVLGQAALLGAALFAQHLLPPDLFDAFVRRNLILIVLNLIPMRPLDGAQTWLIIPRLRGAARLRKLQGRIVVREVPVSRDVKKDVVELLEKIRSSTKVR